MNWIFLIVALYATLTLTQGSGLVDMVKNCFKTQVSPVKGTEMLAMFNVMVESLRSSGEACSEDRLQKTFQCLLQEYNRLISDREVAEKQGLIVDPNRWIIAIKTICDNDEYLKRNEACEAKSRPEFKRCTNAVLENFAEELPEIHRRTRYLTEDPKAETIREFGCLYSTKLHDCLRRPMIKYCPKRMSEILSDVMQNFVLLGCSQRVPSYASSDLHHGDVYNYGPVRNSNDNNNRHNNNSYNSDSSNTGVNDNGDIVRTEEVVYPLSGPGQGQGRDEDDTNGVGKAVGEVILGNPEAVARSEGSDKDGAAAVHAGFLSVLAALLVGVWSFAAPL